MGDSYSAVCGVDALTSRTSGSHDINLQVLFVDLNICLLSFRENCYRNGRGVDSTAGFSFRNSLDPVDTAFISHGAIYILTADGADDFLVSTPFGFVLAHDLDLPPFLLGVVGIHSEDVCSEEGCLLASGSGPDLHDYVLSFQWVWRNKKDLAFLLSFLKLGFQLLDFILDDFHHFAVAFAFQHLFGVCQLSGKLLHLLQLFHNWSQMGPFHHLFLVLLHVSHYFRSAETFVQFLQLCPISRELHNQFVHT